MASQLLAVGAVADRYGLQSWRVLAAIRRGFVQEPARAGRVRIFDAASLPAVEQGLKAAGYLPTDPPPQPAA